MTFLAAEVSYTICSGLLSSKADASLQLSYEEFLWPWLLYSSTLVISAPSCSFLPSECTIYNCWNKIPQTRRLKQWNFNFSQFKMLEIPNQELPGLIPSDASVLGLKMATFLLPFHMLVPCAHAPLVSFCVSEFPLLIWTPVRLD